jgi:hypothetical protein
VQNGFHCWSWQSTTVKAHYIVMTGLHELPTALWQQQQQQQWMQ